MTKLSASEKEKTKIRERNRRSITTKIFQGLRKYGGYNLPPRADINEVFRCLAAEAGWTVEEDGTTYRTLPGGAPALRQASGAPSGRAIVLSSSTTLASDSVLLNAPPADGALLLGGNSIIGASSGNAFRGSSGLFSMHHHHSHNQHLEAIASLLDSRGGDCSTTASPRHHGGSSSAGILFSRQRARHPTNSESLLSVPFGACGCTAAISTPTSSMSFLPSTSSFASPASSEVQEAAAYQCSSRLAASTLTAAQHPQVFPSYASPLNPSYYFSPILDIKEDSLEAIPLDFCSSVANANALEAYGSCQNTLQLASVARYSAQDAKRLQQEQAMIPSGVLYAAGQQDGSAQFHAHLSGSIFSPLLQHTNPFLQEARASNHNTPLGTPMGSPQHHS